MHTIPPLKQLGATMVEYAIMLAFVAMVVMVGVTVLGQKTNALLTDSANKFPSPC